MNASIDKWWNTNRFRSDESIKFAYFSVKLAENFSFLFFSSSVHFHCLQRLKTNQQQLMHLFIYKFHFVQKNIPNHIATELASLSLSAEMCCSIFISFTLLLVKCNLMRWLFCFQVPIICRKFNEKLKRKCLVYDCKKWFRIIPWVDAIR